MNEYNIQSLKNKKSNKKGNSKINKNSSFKNNIILFSFQAINSILGNNLNSSISLSMFNIINNMFEKNNNKITNNNAYINSINDCIDYKLKGNIYKNSEENFLQLYPNLENIIRNKSLIKLKTKKELKVLKFDREIINMKSNTPIKKISKNFYFNLMENKNINININNNSIKENSILFENNNDTISISYENKFKKLNKNRNNYIYRTSTTLNSKDKKNIEFRNIRTFKTKISPINKYNTNKVHVKSKDKNNNINKNINNNKKIEYTPKKELFIIHKKNKDKSNEINLFKTKENNNINDKIKSNINLENSKNKIINNNQSPKEIKYLHFRKINLLNNNKFSMTPKNENLNITENKMINYNKNLNIKYNPTISNSILFSEKNKLNNINYNKKKEINSFAINNFNKNKINSQNKILYKKNSTIDNNKFQIKSFKTKNHTKINSVFENDGNNIFKILDNTQIITSDECRNSISKKNDLHCLSEYNSNGSNTFQDTDYNSIKFNNHINDKYKEDYYEGKENKNTYENYEKDEIFSFYNL